MGDSHPNPQRQKRAWHQGWYSAFLWWGGREWQKKTRLWCRRVHRSQRGL